MSPLDTLRFLWSRLSTFDKLFLATVVFLAASLWSLRILGYS